MPVVESDRIHSLRRTLAQQLAPIIALQGELIVSWTLPVDRAAARARIGAGEIGYDPIEMIGSAGDLVVPFLRATVALARSGVLNEADLAPARSERMQVLEHAAAWIGGEALPTYAPRRGARLAATLVAGSVLRRASTEIRAGEALTGWQKSVCPCCGGAPDLAMRRMRRRTLICSRCDAGWDASPHHCLGCGAVGEPVVMRVASPMPEYELCICNQCGRYLKERRRSSALNLLVERAMTAQIDAAAEMRGLRA